MSYLDDDFDNNLLEDWMNQPDEVRAILDSWDCEAELYAECKRVKAELNAIGWDCEYGLCGEITELKKLD